MEKTFISGQDKFNWSFFQAKSIIPSVWTSLYLSRAQKRLFCLNDRLEWTSVPSSLLIHSQSCFPAWIMIPNNKISKPPPPQKTRSNVRFILIVGVRPAVMKGFCVLSCRTFNPQYLKLHPLMTFIIQYGMNVLSRPSSISRALLTTNIH